MEHRQSYPVSGNSSASSTDTETNKTNGYTTSPVPSISLPKSGGAIKSIDEKFSVNAVNGTATCSLAFPFSPSRNGFMPALTLGYNSGGGNGMFGLGWSAEPAAIVRRTDKQLPQYNDASDSDVFIYSGAEDLVPVFMQDAEGDWIKDSHTENGITITRYRPRIEGLFARIEKITEANGNVYWKVTTGDNIVSVFGKSAFAQVANPGDPAQIFKWQLEFSYDDKGNCFQYEYKQEDTTQVPDTLHEKSRLHANTPCVNAYLKRIKYCNRQHFHREQIDWNNWTAFLQSIEYLLELVLDYGEHHANDPQPDDNNDWLCRTDPFSEYRAGFEIRTYRLCRRVLMFHRFAELGPKPCLVSSMDFNYDTGTAFTFLQSVIQKGYIRQADGVYSSQSFPAVEFTYEKLAWNTDIRSLTPASYENLPAGIDDSNYQWIDLYNEGIAGILTEQGGSWFYKSNAGDGQFDPMQAVGSKPSLNGVSEGALHFVDLEAKGQQFLVSNDLQGYYELNDDNEWLPFKNFEAVPNVDMQQQEARMLDLNGDGIPDLLVSENEVFTWYAAKGKEGFDTHRTAPKAIDEDNGLATLFTNGVELIALADMSGDGLIDIVRIRNSEIVYWPNLGYGNFGAKVTMSNAPQLDRPDHFNPMYLKLADLDGSGTADIIYLGNNSCKIYFNQSGNSWSETNIVNGANPLPFPQTDVQTNVNVIDLLGNGTACIVWSSPLPAHSAQSLQYIDLTNGKKPHLLIAYKNNMGREVAFEYKPSTFYYLQDKKAGTPWVTKLPFPVQCVSKVVQVDQVRKSRFTNQYSYHHGFYDHFERELRGFGRVDQTDTEDFEQFKKLSDSTGGTQIIEEDFHQPPVLTKTWYHTGAFLDKEKVLTQFAHEYYQNNIVPEKELADPVQPAGLSTEEWRQALRACKGLPLRVEIYAPDGSDQQQHPYTTTHHSCLIQLVQPALHNKFAVLMVQQSETLTYNYERNPADPRIAHNMTIETDALGNVLQAAAISYGRKTANPSLTTAEQAQQSKTHIIFSQKKYTNTIDGPNDYRLPVEFENTTWELTGCTPIAGDYFLIDVLKEEMVQAQVIVYEAQPAPGLKQKRLIENIRSLFLQNDLSGPAPFGVLPSLALPYQAYKLSLTPGLRDFIFGDKVSDALLRNEGRYISFNDDNYWIASGTQTFDAAHFYQVTAITDPFGVTTHITYDPVYRYFVHKTTDALQNETAVEAFNFRTLSTCVVRDINDNRTGARTNELGLVTAVFRMGKANEQKGDLMITETTEASTGDRPSVIMEYDLFNFSNHGKPNFIKITAHETHHFDSVQSGEPVATQLTYVYVCGGGKPVMQKEQAEPGIALQENADGTVTEVDTTPNLRWIGNGRTILNNKGKPVKQFEPYFSTTFEFEDARELVERGVTPVLFYDSAGRMIKTDLPDGTFTKLVFDAWMTQAFDQNDTVLESRWYKDRIIEPVPGIATPEEIDAANKAAAHANTPAVVHLDALGNQLLTIADNGAAGQYKTTLDTDREGNLRQVTDARGNVVITYKYDMLGAQLYQKNIDEGERWSVNDVMGKPLRSIGSRGHVLRFEYDVLHRPLHLFLQTAGGQEITVEKLLYPETLTDAKLNNLLGKAWRQYDAAGVVTSLHTDFKGNPLEGSRQLLRSYKGNADWQVLTDDDLEEAVYTAFGSFDALNRPMQMQLQDGSIIRRAFNKTGLLNQVFVQLNGNTETSFVKDIRYNAKGQRELIIYGNDTKSSYQYDIQNFRLTQLLTTGKNGVDWLQKLQYTYDPAGNVTTAKDEAQQTLFFNNAVVSPSGRFTYDAIYRLIHATGREHIGQNGPPLPVNDPRTGLPLPGDGAAMRNYTQLYAYDEVGNLMQLIHAAGAGSYTRTYTYGTDSNRLANTTVGSQTDNYQYDAHGNITGLAHVPSLTWNYKDQLQQVDLGGGGTAYYVYDNGGERIRKVIERQDGSREQRIYLGGVELFHRFDSSGRIQEETETVHVMDDSRRIALVETKTVKEGVLVDEDPLIRFQYVNGVGSSTLETDQQGAIISYEEYHPFGTTAYQAMNAAINAAAKRYRYTGMENDEESGLCYHGARYYLPWLGRWLSPDPIDVKGGLNVYAYADNNPIVNTDTSGQKPDTKENEHADTSQKQELSPAYENGWTYGSTPDRLFFQYDGSYAYTNDNFKTIHPIDNKEFSIILSNGVPVINWPGCGLFEVPANLLSENPGEISSAGTRWHAQGPRQFYKNPVALGYATAGYYQFADVWEAGHGCAGCHLQFLKNGPVPDEELDLDRYTRVAIFTKLTADYVGAKYDPRNGVTIAGMGVRHALNAPPRTPAPAPVKPSGPSVTLIGTPRINTGGPTVCKENCLFVATAATAELGTSSTVAHVTGYLEGFIDDTLVPDLWQKAGLGKIPPLSFPDRASAYQYLKNLPEGSRFMVVNKWQHLPGYGHAYAGGIGRMGLYFRDNQNWRLWLKSVFFGIDKRAYDLTVYIRNF